MSSQLKNVLMVIVSALMALCSGWLVRAAYERGNFILPLVLLILFVCGQVYLGAFVRSSEERELQLRRELELGKIRQKLIESEKLSERIQVEIRSGNLSTARECMDIRDLL